MLFVFRKRNEKITVIKNMAGSEKKHSPTANVGPPRGSQTPSVHLPQLGPPVAPAPLLPTIQAPFSRIVRYLEMRPRRDSSETQSLQRRKDTFPQPPGQDAFPSGAAGVRPQPTAGRTAVSTRRRALVWEAVGAQMCFLREDGQHEGCPSTGRKPPQPETSGDLSPGGTPCVQNQ